MIKELPVFPQFITSVNQGKIGTRRWRLSACEDLEKFLRDVCSTPWPGDENALPVMVQYGAEEGMLIKKPTTLETLPEYNDTMVVAQYQFLHLTDCWPTGLKKPAHPAGTTLTIRVRGSGQFLQITPAGLYSTDGNHHVVAPQYFTDPNTNSRILIPIAEYHLSCDRMTKDDVDNAMGGPAAPWKHWRYREGTVNNTTFLGERRGCLLFESWELDQTFAPSVDDPTRFRLTCVLRARQIPGRAARATVGDEPIGWNYDYVLLDTGNYGWRFREMRDQNGNLVPRYPERSFLDLFCTQGGGILALDENPCDPPCCAGADCEGSSEESSSAGSGSA